MHGPHHYPVGTNTRAAGVAAAANLTSAGSGTSGTGQTLAPMSRSGRVPSVTAKPIQFTDVRTNRGSTTGSLDQGGGRFVVQAPASQSRYGPPGSNTGTRVGPMSNSGRLGAVATISIPLVGSSGGGNAGGSGSPPGRGSLGLGAPSTNISPTGGKHRLSLNVNAAPHPSSAHRVAPPPAGFGGYRPSPNEGGTITFVDEEGNKDEDEDEFVDPAVGSNRPSIDEPTTLQRPKFGLQINPEAEAIPAQAEVGGFVDPGNDQDTEQEFNLRVSTDQMAARAAMVQSYRLGADSMATQGFIIDKDGVRILPERIKQQNQRARRLNDPSQRVQAPAQDEESDNRHMVVGIKISYSDLIQVSELGKGQSGKVYKSVHLPTFTVVALKHINALERSTRHQFVKELATFASINNPFLIRLLGAFFHEGQIAMALECMNAGMLQSFVEKNGPVPDRLLRSFAKQIFLGLQHLHDKAMLHNDIKPANVLLSRSGYCKLCDFGLTKQLERKSEKYGQFIGTMLYLAPERFDAEGCSYPSDVWSAGLTIYYCATGSLPWSKDYDYWKLVDAIKNGNVSLRPDHYHPDLCDFLAQCLQRDPAKRPECKVLLQHPYISKMDVPVPMPDASASEKELDEIFSAVIPKMIERNIPDRTDFREMATQLGLEERTVRDIYLKHRNASSENRKFLNRPAKGASTLSPFSDELTPLSASPSSASPQSMSTTPSPMSSSTTPSPSSDASINRLISKVNDLGISENGRRGGPTDPIDDPFAPPNRNRRGNTESTAAKAAAATASPTNPLTDSSNDGEGIVWLDDDDNPTSAPAAAESPTLTLPANPPFAKPQLTLGGQQRVSDSSPFQSFPLQSQQPQTGIGASLANRNNQVASSASGKTNLTLPSRNQSSNNTTSPSIAPNLKAGSPPGNYSLPQGRTEASPSFDNPFSSSGSSSNPFDDPFFQPTSSSTPREDPFATTTTTVSAGHVSKTQPQQPLTRARTALPSQQPGPVASTASLPSRLSDDPFSSSSSPSDDPFAPVPTKINARPASSNKQQAPW